MTLWTKKCKLEVMMVSPRRGEGAALREVVGGWEHMLSELRLENIVNK